MATPAHERVLARSVAGPGGCLIYTGSLNKYGYGNVGVKVADKWITKKAHRVVYEALVGPIPEGLFLDHLCRIRSCCNPAHLEPVTHLENVRRGQGNQYKNRTDCSAGHPYTPENTRLRNGKERVCLACERRRKEKQKAIRSMQGETP
jgi:hypothetical protein